MTDCLILGATGFIGGQIARAAVARGWRVTGVRRRADATGAIGDLPIAWAQGDLDDAAGLQELMQGGPASPTGHPPSVIFHSASAYPHNPRTRVRDTAAALRQMRNVLAATRAAGVARLIYTSSYTTIGLPAAPDQLSDEDDFYVPGSTDDPYYEAKWAMEAEALQAARLGLPVVVLCPTAVFGPGDVHMAVSGPLLLAAQGRLPVYFDAALNVIDVRDVAASHVAAGEGGQIGARYILGGHNVTLYAALAEMAHVAGVRPPRIKIGARLLRLVATAGQLAPGGQASFLKTIPLWRPVSNAKASRDLGLTPRPLHETIADTFTWLRTRGAV